MIENKDEDNPHPLLYCFYKKFLPADVCYLEAEVRDDGRESVRPEQRHHQLLQALVDFKVLPEERKSRMNEDE